MRIGIDVRKLNDYGIGTHIRNVVLPAARLATSDQFYLYCDPKDAVSDNGHFTWVPEESSKYSIREQFALSRKAGKQRIDLFHSPHYTLPLRLGCRSIVTIHDLIHLKFASYYPYWKVKAAGFVLKRAVSRAELVLTVSNASKQDILEFFPEAGNKLEVLYNRLSEEWLRPSPSVDIRNLGIPSDFLLYIGNFKKHKGIATLLQAYRRLKDPPALVLAGNRGGIDSDLLAQIFSLPHVRLLGFAEGDLLRKLYADAMLFVFPSLYEGFGYPPLEAMASGTPVLSSDAPALKEVLGDAAEFFQRNNSEDLEEKLMKLLEKEEMREKLREAGRQRAKLFTSEDSPRRLLQIYRELSP
jgi:glycosyltransferase involved in cell wall biosynthesis